MLAAQRRSRFGQLLLRPLPGAAGDENDEARTTVTVKRAIDGDTIEISPAVDGKDTVRLIGIDAPEAKSQECGAQPLAGDATDHAALWEGLKVELEFDEDRTDRYGRLLAYVHNDLIMSTMMNVDMVESGYAQVYIVPPNTKHEDELRKAQKEAKELSLGIGLDFWSLSPAKEAQLADHGNGIGSGDGACPAKPQPEPQPNPNPQPDPNNEDRNAPDYNAPDYNAPSTASPAAGAGRCEPPAYWVGPGGEGDGDGDGCAGEE